MRPVTGSARNDVRSLGGANAEATVLFPTALGPSKQMIGIVTEKLDLYNSVGISLQ